jgi:hypothetical protein
MENAWDNLASESANQPPSNPGGGWQLKIQTARDEQREREALGIIPGSLGQRSDESSERRSKHSTQ